MRQRRSARLQYRDVLNSLIEVAAEHVEMTDEIMYKTCVQFFTDGYETASQVEHSKRRRHIRDVFRSLVSSYTTSQ